MPKTIPDLNRALAKAGAPVTLYRGYGYLYYVYDDVPANVWQDRSMPLCHFKQMPFVFWLEEGLRFAAEVRAQREALAQREARFAALMEYDPDADEDDEDDEDDEP